jgi:transcriptional regulator with XRE-family HTH domain
MSRQRVAVAAGISIGALNNWEQGRTSAPDAPLLASVAAVLDVPLEDLLIRVDEVSA